MRRRGSLFRTSVLIVLLAGLAASCRNDMMRYYEEPDWIKGSLYEILQEKGNYTLFLQGVDSCGYTALLQGRSILTVMAPDDTAMRAWLQNRYGTTDIASLPKAELKKLIGFHILYYALDSEKLINFRPSEGDGATDEQKLKNAGLFYKFRTRSQDAPEKVSPERIVVNDAIVDTSGIEVDVYHLERFIPVFSYKMFQTKLINAKQNYEYFFGDGTWHGDGGFNVSDASVQEYEIIAKNGYLYLVDRVVAPLETIHRELENNPQYSQYLKLYDQYAYYDIDEEQTSLFGGGTTTYYHRLYEQGSFNIPNISSEWPVSSYTSMSALSRQATTVFAPTNAAFDEFYQSYWGDEETGYPTAVSYDSISSDAIGYLLSNSFYTGGLAFPEEITRGDIENAYTKTVINFDVDAVPQANRKICVNGALYGQSILTPPAVFGSVTGPAYKYKKYGIFLKMLTTANLQATLTSDAVNFIMLYPSNAQFEANNIWYNADEDRIKSGIPGSTTSTNVGSGAQSKMVNAHLVSLPGAAEQLPGSGLKVYRTLSTDYKLYWYVKDGKITNSLKYNRLIRYAGNMDIVKDSVYTDFEELLFRGQPWSNGHCYEYDTQKGRFLLEGTNENAIYAKFVPMMYAHRNDDNTLFQGFIQVLLKAGLIDEQAQSMNYMTENCLMLVPVTSAVKTAIVGGKFPFLSVPDGTTADDAAFWTKVVAPADATPAQDSLQHYLLEYFLPESTMPVTDYPYPGWGADTEADGGISSIADLTTTPTKSAYIYIYDRGTKLTAKVQGMTEEIDFYGEYDYLPFVYDDGCVQFINGIFEDKWPH